MNIVRLMLLSRQMKNRRHEKNNMVTGIPPLNFTAKNTGALKNYRIYGNTVNGNSVGDKTANLFDMSDYNPNNVTANDDGSFYIGWNAEIWAFSCKVETGKTYFLSWEELNKSQNNSWLSVAAKAGYHVGFSQPCYTVTLKGSPPNVWYKRYVVFTATDDYLSIDGMGTYIRNIMLVEGSMPLPYEPYEPYGYKVPVTICGENLFRKSEIEYNAYLKEDGQTQPEVPPDFTSDTSQYISIIPGETYTLTRTGSRRVKFYGYDKNPLTNTFDADATNSDITFIAPQNAYYIRFTINHSISLKTVKLYVSDTTLIYLDAPLTKPGNIADYIDYAAHKRHNSDGTESSVTLPEIAVAVGTNTLTVGTEVQPSRVELMGRIKEAQTNGSGNT